VSADDLAAIAGLPALGTAFGLALARISACVMLLPGLGETDLPATVRAGLALGLTLLLLPAVAPLVPSPAPESGLVLAGMVLSEIVTGLWLGTLARLVVQALPVAGQVISYLLGLSNVLQPDPAIGAQATALGRLLGLLVPVLVLASGLYRLPLAALAGSYRLIAPGALLPSADASASVVAAVGGAFALALRLSAPFVLASIVWQVALALTSRLIPRLQVHALAMPGQILGGLALFALLAGAMLAGWQEAVRAVLADLGGL
jgi:flagellar biosynthetic protein FliR